MKVVFLALLALAAAEQASPIEKVIQMITDLQAKVVGEGEDSHAIFVEFADACDGDSKQLEFEIKTAKGQVAELNAKIEDATAEIGSADAKIEELSASIATDEAELKEATEIRDKEHADFVKEEKELVEVLDMLERATGILKKELGGGASMLQLQNANSVVQALNVLVQASMFSSKDASRLTALVQSSSSDEDAGEPAAAVYESHSSGIIDTLEGLTDKANEELDTARSTETKAQQNYEMQKQSLEDSIKYANEDMDKTKTAKAEAEEEKANAEGELDVVSKDLAADEKALADLHRDCMEKANAYEEEVKSRTAELEALAKAKQVIEEATGGAASQQYDFLQLSTSSDLGNFEAVRFVRDLSRKQQSSALAQLASRMASTIRLSHGADVFAKVKGLITDMIAKLEKEAAEDATEKAYCDKEMGETQAKKDEKNAEIEKLTTKIDADTSKSAKLKEEVATLQEELAALAKRQAEMDKIRAEEKAVYDKNRPEMEAGIKGVKLALKVLRDYYAGDDNKAQGASDGAASGIIGLLEVCESDFEKSLAEMISDEEAAAAEYEDQTKENEVTKAAKEQDVKYKTKEAADADKRVAENSKDRAAVQDELDAVNEYWAELEDRCVAKAETYEDRKARRDNEIAGLKQALQILESEAALIQTSSRHLRGVHAH